MPSTSTSTPARRAIASIGAEWLILLLLLATLVKCFIRKSALTV